MQYVVIDAIEGGDVINGQEHEWPMTVMAVADSLDDAADAIDCELFSIAEAQGYTPNGNGVIAAGLTTHLQEHDPDTGRHVYSVSGLGPRRFIILALPSDE